MAGLMRSATNNSLLDRIERLERELRQLKTRPVVARTLADITQDMGVQAAGMFVAADGEVVDPSDAAFSGTFMSALKQAIADGNEARIAEVLNGVAQFWVADGAAWFGAGAGKIDALGLLLKLLIDTSVTPAVKITWQDAQPGSAETYANYTITGGSNINYFWRALLQDNGAPNKSVEIRETVLASGTRSVSVLIDGTSVFGVTDGGTYIGDATNGVKVGPDGHMTFLGTATYSLDEKGQLSSAKITSPSSKIIQDDAENAYYFKDSATTADYLWLNIQFNHDRKNGAVVSPHFHWWQTSATIPNFLLQYRWEKQGSGKTTAWTSAKWSSHAFTYVSGTLNQITDFPDITPPSADGLSDQLQVRIIRDTANASGLFSGVDGLAGDVYMTDFDAHKTCDSLGSNTEYSKT